MILSGLTLCSGIIGIFATTSRSGLVFSPDRNYAAQAVGVRGFGSDEITTVFLYSQHGFKREFAFAGYRTVVGENDLDWAGNGNLFVRYHGGWVDLSFCYKTRRVKVHCAPAEMNEPGTASK